MALGSDVQPPHIGMVESSTEQEQERNKDTQCNEALFIIAHAPSSNGAGRRIVAHSANHGFYGLERTELADFDAPIKRLHYGLTVAGG